jgi:hypothetical protein
MCMSVQKNCDRDLTGTFYAFRLTLSHVVHIAVRLVAPRMKIIKWPCQTGKYESSKLHIKINSPHTHTRVLTSLHSIKSKIIKQWHYCILIDYILNCIWATQNVISQTTQTNTRESVLCISQACNWLASEAALHKPILTNHLPILPRWHHYSGHSI